MKKWWEDIPNRDNGMNEGQKVTSSRFWVCFFVSFAVLEFELRAYILSHSTSPFVCWGFFEIGLTNYLTRLALSQDPPDLCLLGR
jgi:hypothetical protein